MNYFLLEFSFYPVSTHFSLVRQFHPIYFQRTGKVDHARQLTELAQALHINGHAHPLAQLDGYTPRKPSSDRVGIKVSGGGSR